MKATILAAVLLGLASSASAQWLQDGVKVCGFTGTQTRPVAIPDGAGGAIIVWEDGRYGSQSGRHTYAQRIDAAGVPHWTEDGVRLCMFPSDEEDPRIVSDGAGGAIVAWNSGRRPGDIFAQHIDANGTTLWSDTGLQMCSAPGGRKLAGIVEDGAGGVIAAWIDNRVFNWDAYAQRVSGDGILMWGELAAPVCVAEGARRSAHLVGDGQGGAIVAWADSREQPWDIYAQRVSEDGSPLWTVDGVRICAAPFFEYASALIGTNGGGAIIMWTVLVGQIDIRAQRLSGAGKSLWADDGVSVYSSRFVQLRPVIAADGGNGAIIGWADARDGDSDVYAQHILASGKAAWTSDGVVLCGAQGHQSDLSIVADGAKGAIVTWQDSRMGIGVSHLHAQRVSASGTPVWMLDGSAICTAAGPVHAQTLISDASGGAIMAWDQRRTEQDYDVYANHVNANGGIAGPATTKFATFAQAPWNSPSMRNGFTAFPNPFSGSTRLNLMVDDDSSVLIDVFDATGRLVRRIQADSTENRASATFDGHDQAGHMLPSGVYFCRVVGNYSQPTRKLVLVR